MYDAIRKINPRIHPPAYSVIYTFTTEDIVQVLPDSTIYRIPYSEATFWTHVKYDSVDAHESRCRMEVILAASDESRTSLSPAHIMTPHTWYPMTWPLPSVSTPRSTGLFLQIWHDDGPGSVPYSLHIMGFHELYPDAAVYLLIGSAHTCTVAFQRNVVDIPETDTIYVRPPFRLRETIIPCAIRIPML